MADGQTNTPLPPHICRLEDLDVQRPKADIVILQCTVCGRRRIEMVADPIELRGEVVAIG